MAGQCHQTRRTLLYLLPLLPVDIIHYQLTVSLDGLGSQPAPSLQSPAMNHVSVPGSGCLPCLSARCCQYLPASDATVSGVRWPAAAAAPQPFTAVATRLEVTTEISDHRDRNGQKPGNGSKTANVSSF